MIWLLACAIFIALWLGQPARLVAQGEPPTPVINCFATANRPGEGILLAWRTNITDTTTFGFEMARAQFTSPLSELRGPMITEENLPHLQSRTISPDNEELHFAVVDTLVADDTKYAYVLTMTNTISGTVVAVDEETWTYKESADASLQNDEICLSTSAISTWTPTFTPTPTDTVTSVPTNTPTPTVTATPTWTPTPTNTATPTWTLTFTPGPTDTPYPSPTFTPLPTETPIPPTETASPTFTTEPTGTPAIYTPTPEFDANQGADPGAFDPANSILPTPTWTVEIAMNAPSAFDETSFTPTPAFPVDSTPQPAPEITVESPPGQNPASEAPSMAEVPPQQVVPALEHTRADLPSVRSEYPLPPPQVDSLPLLRFALYAVGGLAILSALAFLLGVLALIGTDKQS